MDPLTPIPTPPAQRWREFRIQVLPPLAFVAVMACVGLLWQRYVFPSNIVAQVETENASVITTVAGKIETLAVQRYQHVKKGDIIAILSIADTNVLSAELETVRADLALMRERIEVGTLRGTQNYEQQRLTYLEQRAQWLEDQVNVKLAEATFRIQDDLMRRVPPLTDSNTFNQAYFRWEALQVRVREMEAFLKEKEHVLPKLLADTTNNASVIEQAIEAQTRRILAASSNIVLLAPMDGIITSMTNTVGERVMGGSAIATISSTKAERIIAYMRQPIATAPKPGDTVQVRRRTFRRQTATATISDVGPQLEPVSPALMLPGVGKVDLGLPFAVNLPSQLNLLPGEIVDVIYEPKH